MVNICMTVRALRNGGSFFCINLCMENNEPNAGTIAAIEEARSGKNLETIENLDDFLNEL